MNDKVKQIIIELGGWIDTEKDGLAYDHATHFCHDCPRRDDAIWREHVAPDCCKEAEDYQAQEWETIRAAENALKALAELNNMLNGNSAE
jgi:hypothetical protein